MKVKWLATAALLLVVGTAHSEEKKKGGFVDSMSGQGYNMAGCGLGAMALGSEPGKGRALASALLNSFVFPQTFAISTGISNCGESANKKASLEFIDGNKEALKNDVARGNGETISALSNILGCKNSNFSATLQKNSSSILKAETSEQMNSEVLKSCQI